MKDVFDQTLDVFNGEVDNVDANFTAFVANLKGEIQFGVIQGNVDIFTQLVQNYSLDIKPTMENTLETVTNITNLLDIIQADCPASLCEDFIIELNLVLEDGLYKISLPDLPADIQSNLEVVQQTLSNVDMEISNVNISGQLAGLQDQINSIRQEFDDLLNTLEQTQAEFFRTEVEIPAEITDYFQYIHIAVVSLAGLMAALLALILLGLTCGVCSRRGSSSAKTGSNLICGSFSVFFILSALLFILCAALLLVGAITEKAVCDSLEDPDSSQVFQLAENVLQEMFFNDLYNGTYNLSISEVIHGIHNNTPLYPLLHLDVLYNVTDLENWEEDFNIAEMVDEFKLAINTTIEVIVNMRDDIPVDNINQAASTIDVLLNPVIPLIVEFDLASVEEPITLIEDLLTEPSVTGGLRGSLQEMLTQLNNLQISTQSVQDSFNLILDNLSLAQNGQLALGALANETFILVDEAFLKIPVSVTLFVDTTVQNLLDAINTQVPWIVSSIENDIGRTEILSNIYNATYTFICLDIVAPVNSVWSGLGFTLLLLLFPLLFLSCSLIKIFRTDLTDRRTRPYYL